MEILAPTQGLAGSLKAVLFDFDGTISTLRCGWEAVMAPLMTEVLQAAGANSSAVPQLVAGYIDRSTGIQTIFQMQWLAEQVQALGKTPPDPWDYKEEYNRRLMETVSQRREAVQAGLTPADSYLVCGSVALLHSLKQAGVRLLVASGTDQADVEREAQILGVAGFFDSIAGAPPRQADCSKARVIKSLMEQSGLAGRELAVVGDGPVEIQLAREAGALALGVASDEAARRGLNPVKRDRLIRAGAHAIVGDFEDLQCLLDWLGVAQGGIHGQA